ncbi:hypothetical protein FACS1894177_05220 [Bacteroidia bacterium]|nr:hypothetical protein FACS1894177_05220 [Bacteroidia bacterium]
MRQILFIFFVLLPFVVASAQEKQAQSNHSFFHIDIFDYKYYFCDECDFPKSTHNLTLNLLGGTSKNQYGLVVGTLLNVIDNNAYGIQIAGLYNYVGNQGKGLAVTGFINNYKSHTGVQIAGFNTAEKMRGVQIGFVNSSIDMQGIQIGFMNNYEGLQTLKGLQIGVLNEGKSRFQIGLCNISENNQYPLGLVNIVKNGEMNVGLASDEIGNVTAQFLSGGQYLYGIVGLGFNTKSSDHLILQGGIGAHLNFSSKFRINMEVSTKFLTRTFIYVGNDDAEYEKRKKEFDFKALTGYSFGIFPSFNFVKKIELFGGPTLNYLHTNTLDNKSLFSSKYIWKDFNSTSLRQLYIGYSVGLRYVLKN